MLLLLRTFTIKTIKWRSSRRLTIRLMRQIKFQRFMDRNLAPDLP